MVRGHHPQVPLQSQGFNFDDLLVKDIILTSLFVLSLSPGRDNYKVDMLAIEYLAGVHDYCTPFSPEPLPHDKVMYPGHKIICGQGIEDLLIQEMLPLIEDLIHNGVLFDYFKFVGGLWDAIKDLFQAFLIHLLGVMVAIGVKVLAKVFLKLSISVDHVLGL